MPTEDCGTDTGAGAGVGAATGLAGVSTIGLAYCIVLLSVTLAL